MPAATAVDRSTLKLSEAARHVVVPEGIVDTLWFEVEERCREFGVEFDVWQDGLGQVILGIRDDGMFAATVGGVTLSIPRQVAKTFMVMMIVLGMCTLHPNLTVVWTAHRLRTATNTFQKMKAVALRPAVRKYVRPGTNQGTAIRDANGEQEIPFANGSRIMFGAREQGFGRGFDEVDIEVFDEAQILSIKALEDMVAATNQSRFPFGALLFYMGTPPRPEDPGDVFAARRAEALDAKEGLPDFGEPVAAGDAVYVECSADPDVGQPGGPSLDDPEQVNKANPSHPHRTPPVSVRRLRKNLTDDDAWRREGLGVWDSPESTVAPPIIPADVWGKRVAEAPADGRVAYGVKFSPNGELVSLAGAVAGDAVHVEGIRQESVTVGTRWLVEWLAARKAPVVIDGKSGSGALQKALLRAGVPVRRIHRPTVDEVVAAHAGFVDAVMVGEVTHSGDPALDMSLVVRRAIGKSGGWGFAGRERQDVSLQEAAVLAHWGVVTLRPVRSTSTRRAVVR